MPLGYHAWARPMGCLDEQTVVAFVSGALAGTKLAEAERHLLECADCSTLVALAAPVSVPRHTTLEWAGAPPTDELPPPSAAVNPAARTSAVSPAPPPETVTAVVDVGSSKLLRLGGMVGRYRLLHLVGRGGMG